MVNEPVYLKISITPECLNEYNTCFLFKCIRLLLKMIPKGLKIKVTKKKRLFIKQRIRKLKFTDSNDKFIQSFVY